MSRAVKTWSDVIGYVAMVLILGTYAAFTWGAIGKPMYLGIGILTSVLMAFHGWERKSYQMVALNGVWLIFSVIGLVRG